MTHDKPQPPRPTLQAAWVGAGQGLPPRGSQPPWARCTRCVCRGEGAGEGAR